MTASTVLKKPHEQTPECTGSDEPQKAWIRPVLSPRDVEYLLNPDSLEGLDNYVDRTPNEWQRSMIKELLEESVYNAIAKEIIISSPDASAAEQMISAVVATEATFGRRDEDGTRPFRGLRDQAAIFAYDQELTVHMPELAEAWKSDDTDSQPDSSAKFYETATLLSSAVDMPMSRKALIMNKCAERRNADAAHVYRSDDVKRAIGWEDETVLDSMNNLQDNLSGRNYAPAVEEEARDLMAGFMKNHKPSPGSLEVFARDVVPRLAENDPSLRALTDSHGSGDIRFWGYGEVLRYRPEDFCLAPLINEVTPLAVREWMDALKDVPTANRFIVEQNRIDALRLDISGMGEYRQMVHDDRPGVHDTTVALLEYAASGDEDVFASAISALSKKYSRFGIRWNSIKDQAISADFSQVAESSPYGDKLKFKNGESMSINAGADTEETVEDVLVRLERNTQSVGEEPPAVVDGRLAQLLQTAFENKSDRTSLQAVTDYINTVLQTAVEQKQVGGIEPSFIEALSWVESRQFEYMKALTFEDQIGLHKSELFRSLMLTHELTHNDAFDSQEFADYMDQLAAQSDSAAAESISNRVLTQLTTLASYYKSHGRKDWSDGLFSGNVTHELTALPDARYAVTAIGEKMRRERVEPGKYTY